MRGDLHAHLVVVAHAVGVVDDATLVVRHAFVAFLLGVQESRLDIFVVQDEQAILGGLAVDWEEVDPVMALADLMLLLGAGIGTGSVGGHVARDRLAGRAEDLEAVAFGNDHSVLEAHRHGREADE